MSESIINFNNRTLRVEHDGWYLEVKVLASGTQIAITANGHVDGNSELIIRPDTANRVFISSRASEKETEQPNAEPNSSQDAQRDSGGRRPPKR